MAKKQELEITISETGEVTISVLSAKGKSCLEMTKELEEELGLVENRELKSSYYEQDETGHVRLGMEETK